MRRPAAKLKITQTDAEPTGSAPLGSSAVGLRRSTHIAEIFQTDVEPAGPTAGDFRCGTGSAEFAAGQETEKGC